MRPLATHILTVILLPFFGICTTRALPLPSHELSIKHALLGRYQADPGSPAVLIGREIHNADFNNAGGPPQTTNSSSSPQDSNAASQSQHPSPGTQAKSGSTQQDSLGQPNTKATRSESKVSAPKFYARKHETIKGGDRRHSLQVRTLATAKQGGQVPQLDHLMTVSSRKVTHQDPYSNDEKETTPPPSTKSSILPGSPLLIGIDAPPFSSRYENEESGSNGINNIGDESIHGAEPLSRGIKAYKTDGAGADDRAPNYPVFFGALDPYQAD